MVAHKRFLAWGNWHDALDEVAGWCEDHAPGLLVPLAVVQERHDEIVAEIGGLADGTAWERAEEGLILCDGGLYLDSSEIYIIDKPTREDLLRADGRELDVAFC